LEGFRLLRRAFGLDFSLAPQHGKFPIVIFWKRLVLLLLL
jgi:hypothetical protein